MFHLSLPVSDLGPCLDFYRTHFDAGIDRFRDDAANVFVFGGQLTLHDRPDAAFGPAQRGAMHFGAILSTERWTAARERLTQAGVPIVHHVEPGGGRRGKLVVRDPSGNSVELNATG